ncbi:MAG: acyl carrier protein [Clostridiales bacterium]|nr:acyl carrier protein [Clostridiales bacterium]
MDKIFEMLEEIKPEFDFHSSENFILDGFLDSFDIVLLTSMLEETYKIKIDGLDIVPENFSNVESILQLVKKSGGNA